MPAAFIAFSAAGRDNSDTPTPFGATLHSEIPVRSSIHLSVVSTIFSICLFVKISSGT